MTAAVPLIHAVTVARMTGIMVEQTGESEGSRGGAANGEEKGKDELRKCVLEKSICKFPQQIRFIVNNDNI